MVTKSVSYPAEAWPGALQLTVDVSENYDNPPDISYRLSMLVTGASNIDPNIFVFEAVPSSAGRDYSQVRFITVATPEAMNELPLVEPSEGADYRYRDDHIDLYFRTADELEAARLSIIRRVNSLLAATESMESMETQMVINWTFSTDEDSSEA